ncbi:MAG TPA: LysR family transcriptional regulator [Candidatus Saccharimonadales bacterium]|jgi:DNA-binding transcriptional LysR family regulator|nr:LysR family transcriptional regulator [Candidatus Saccharimonadales bacterium]
MEDRLHKFAVLVDNGSFTKAAQELHTSQPALSIAIAKLEQELRAKLIVRGVRPFKLTEAGKVVYDTAKKLFITTDNLKIKLAELSNQQLSISIGMIDSIASMLFLSNTNIYDLEQEAKISVVVNNSRSLLNAIEHDELDIAYVTEQINPVGRHIQAQFIAIEPLVLVVHHSQAAATQSALEKGRLENFISYDQSSNSYQIIKRSLDQIGIKVSPKFFSTSAEVMLRLVQLQKGVAALPYMLVKDFLADDKLILVGSGRPIIIDRRIYSLMRRDKLSNHLITKITKRVKQQLNYYYREINR